MTAKDTWNIPKKYELVITVMRFYFRILKNRLLGLNILIYPGVFKLTKAFITA